MDSIVDHNIQPMSYDMQHRYESLGLLSPPLPTYPFPIESYRRCPWCSYEPVRCSERVNSIFPDDLDNSVGRTRPCCRESGSLTRQRRLIVGKSKLLALKHDMLSYSRVICVIDILRCPISQRRGIKHIPSPYSSTSFNVTVLAHSYQCVHILPTATE